MRLPGGWTQGGVRRHGVAKYKLLTLKSSLLSIPLQPIKDPNSTRHVYNTRARCVKSKELAVRGFHTITMWWKIDLHRGTRSCCAGIVRCIANIFLEASTGSANFVVVGLYVCSVKISAESSDNTPCQCPQTTHLNNQSGVGDCAAMQWEQIPDLMGTIGSWENGEAIFESKVAQHDYNASVMCLKLMWREWVVGGGVQWWHTPSLLQAISHQSQHPALSTSWQFALVQQ